MARTGVLAGIIGAATIGFLANSAALGDPLGGDVKKLAVKFNSAAKSNNLGVRIALTKCETEVRTVCRYKVTSSLQALADSGDGSTLDSVVLALAGGTKSDAVLFIQTMIVMMAAYAPDAQPPERGVIIKDLMNGLDDGTKSVAQLHGVTFTMMKPEGLGLWLLVNKPAAE
jgi:hypothetical protein